MKITGFNPTILTSDLESMYRLFEELGFEKNMRGTILQVSLITRLLIPVSD